MSQKNNKQPPKAITIPEFIGEKSKYDSDGQIIWGVHKNDGLQMLLDLRGWGAIQNAFIRSHGNTEEAGKLAGKFQDDLGQWFVDAINEKLERERA